MKENDFINSIKFIAALFVITIHVPIWGTSGIVVSVLSRFAVPFFFAVSGRYLLVDKETGRCLTETSAIRRKVGSRLKKLLKVTAIIYVIYTLYSLWFHFFVTKEFSSLTEWLSMKYNPYEARAFFLFNSGRFIYDGSYVFDHMWFLFALIYVYLLIWIFAPILRKCYKWLSIILLILLFIGEVMQIVYPIQPFGISIDTWYVLRNWLFVGLPFVLIGIWFGDYQDRDSTKKKHNLGFGISFLAVGLFITFFECILSFVILAKEVYIGSVLLVVGLLFLSECPNIPVSHILSLLGKKASANIYYFHVLVVAFIDMLAIKGIIEPVSFALKPYLVMGICLVIFAVPVIIKDMNN